MNQKEHLGRIVASGIWRRSQQQRSGQITPTAEATAAAARRLRILPATGGIECQIVIEVRCAEEMSPVNS